MESVLDSKRPFHTTHHQIFTVCVSKKYHWQKSYIIIIYSHTISLLALLFTCPFLISHPLKDTSTLSYRVNLDDANTRDGVRIRNLAVDTISSAEHNVHLSSGGQFAVIRTWEGLDLEVAAVTHCDVRWHVVGVETREDNGVHWAIFCDQASGESVLVCVGEGYWRGTSGVWVLRRLDGECWESLKWEGSVTCGEAGDELGGERVDLVEIERGVKGLGEWRFSERGTDVRGVAGLDGQDGTSNSEICLVGDLGSSA